MLRLCSKAVVSDRRKMLDFVYTGQEPMSFAIKLCQRHEAVRKSYEAAVRSGETCVHTFSKVPNKDPAAPLGCAPELEHRMMRADSCLVAAVALLEAMVGHATLTLKSRSKGLLTLTTPTIFQAYPTGFTNPLLSWMGAGNTGFMWSLITPDTAGVHMWVRCLGTAPGGQAHVVNLDPTIEQFGAGLSKVWFGDEHESGTLRFDAALSAGDARALLQREITTDSKARDLYAALRTAMAPATPATVPTSYCKRAAPVAPPAPLPESGASEVLLKLPAH
jgi:hypothetical protein